MREIKFRAWDRNKTRMMFVAAIKWDGSTCLPDKVVGAYQLWEDEVYIDGLQINPCDVGLEEMPIGQVDLMQFTGLHDNTGQEIYEGDIVSVSGEEPLLCESFSTDYNWTFSGVVEMNSCMWLISDPSDKNWLSLAQIITDGDDVEMAVIGNIHENPELLEAK